MCSLFKMMYCKPLKGNDMLSVHVFALEFDNVSYTCSNVCFHASWPPTRRAPPDRIPVVCFEIVGLFDHESPLVVTPLKTIAISLDSEQARNFDKVSNCLKL